MGMRTHEQLGRARVAVITALALLAQPLTPAFAGVNQTSASAGQAAAGQAPAQTTTTAPKTGTQAPKTGTPASATPAKAAPATAAPPDGGWPRHYQTAAGTQIVVYQPQVADWANQKHMTAYAATSVQRRGEPKPALGTVKIEANTKVSVDARLVNFTDMTLADPNFPTLNKEQVREVVDEIVKAIPTEERVIALDRVLASVDKSQIKPKNVEGVKADPPVIFFSKTSAVLVNIDGEPIWSPIKENDLKFAVNTNWELFQHTPTNAYYLLYNGSWLTTIGPVKGTWAPAGKLPESFGKLPADDNWKEAKAALPGKKLDAKKAPQVFVSTAPAEMILLTGEPNYLLVSGTKDLLWVSNTESDVFRVGKTGAVYFLVSGRWFSAPDFKGPWTFVTPNLPEDFKKIPLEHQRSRVLASVPGTSQAAEAVLLASIPQTARVQKSLKAPDVVYDGDPKFEPIEKTTVSRAVNTDKSIIKVGDLYYMCFEGVWFMGQSPEGPWSVTGQVPGEIYEIPVSSPANNVTYVKVEEDNDDAVVFATTMAFTGDDDRLGLLCLGQRLLLPALLRLARRLPVLLRALSHLRLRRELQPVYRGVPPRRGRVRAVRRRRRQRAVQPEDRHLLARRGSLRAVRRPGGGAGLQPAHRDLRPDPPGLERVWQLGIDAGGARRRLGEHLARDQQPHRQHDPRVAGQRRRDHGPSQRRRQHGRRRRVRVWRRLRGARRQRLQEERRQLAEVRRQRQLEQRAGCDAATEGSGTATG